MTSVASTVMELEIESIAAGGDGVGRAEGLVVFVPRTAPHDRAHVRVEPTPGKRFAHGQLDALLLPSLQRVEPPCAHYRHDRCGGCQLQHMRYESQLDAKSAIVRDALVRIGKQQVEKPTVHASPRQWRYRTKLTLAMRRVDRGWTIGLHPYDNPAAVFQLEDCLISDERVVATWREVMAAAKHLPAAAELRGSVRVLEDGAGRAVVIEGGSEWTKAETFFASVPSATALWWKPESSHRRLVAARTATRAGASFTQINKEVAYALRAHLLNRVRSYAPVTVIDAYAGTGETAVPLAASGVRVTAIELDREAAGQCAAALPRGSRTLVGRVEDLLARALPTDVVVVNPPRAGLHERVTALLDRPAGTPRVILYVSCNPATLARDLARLPSFSIASLVAFDMFPQTAHVETVCELVRWSVGGGRGGGGGGGRTA